METRTKILGVVLVVVLIGTAGYFYKDTLLNLAGISLNNQASNELDEIVAASQAAPTNPTQVSQNACNSGNLQDCIALADLYLEEKNSLKAIEVLVAACEKKSGEACVKLSNIYDSGNGVEKSQYLFLGYAQKACEMGNMDGCYDLGVKYYRGEGELIKKDIAKAFQLFNKACVGGNQKGCNNVAVIYNNGENGISRNVKKARELFDVACKSGYAPSCENLAKIK